MANDQISLDEYLTQLNQRINSTNASESSGLGGLGVKPIEPLTYSSSSLHPTYGAVPNVTVGSGITTTSVTGSINGIWSTSGTGTSIGTGSPGMWTNTTGTGYTIGTAGYGNVQAGKVHIQGDNADLVIGDKSMKAWMEKVEERLNILTPNPEMEKEWDQLRKLGERYRKLEKKCKEKSDMWNKLKAMPRPDVK